jgi:hypothetical protein
VFAYTVQIVGQAIFLTSRGKSAGEGKESTWERLMPFGKLVKARSLDDDNAEAKISRNRAITD